MWAMKVFVPGGTIWMMTDEEPQWKKEAKTGRAYLSFEPPEKEPSKYKDAFYGVSRRLYRDEVYAVGPWEVGASVERVPSQKPQAEMYSLLKAIGSGRGRTVTYSQVKLAVGWGQKKLQRILKEAKLNDWYNYTKVGSTSQFDLTDEGIDEMVRLAETYDPSYYKAYKTVEEDK